MEIALNSQNQPTVLLDLDILSGKSLIDDNRAIEALVATQKAATSVMASFPKDLFTQVEQAQADYRDLFKLVSTQNRQIVDSIMTWHKMLANSITAEFQKSLKELLELKINFELPVIHLTPILVEGSVINEDSASAPIAVNSGILELSIDQFGQYTIGDHKITRANAKTSRHGQLLNLLEGKRGQLVSKEQIKDELKLTNADQVLKDLKKELRLLGYRINYTRYRGQGLVYQGVIRKQ